MIPLRIAQITGPLRVSAAASAAINVTRWLYQHEHQSLLVCESGDRVDECESAGLALKRYRAGGPSWLFGGRRQLIDDILAWSPDALHVHRLSALPLALKVSREGLPVVLSLHGGLSEQDVSAVTALAEGAGTAITVPSEFMRAKVASMTQFPADRISVLPYGLQPERFSLKHISSPVATIGCFADEDLSHSFAMLRAAICLEPILAEARVLMVVPAEAHEAGQAIVAAEPDQDRWQVESAGPQTAVMLQRMDAVVYAVQHDSHSLTVIKSQLAGRPVIAAAVGSMTELIHDELTGLIVPVGDASALASALSGLVDDPGYALELAQQGQAQALQRHALDVVGPAWERLYRGLLRGSRSTTTEAQDLYRRLSESDPSDSSTHSTHSTHSTRSPDHQQQAPDRSEGSL